MTTDYEQFSEIKNRLGPIEVEQVDPKDRFQVRPWEMYFVHGMNHEDGTLNGMMDAFIYLTSNAHSILNNPSATMTTLDGHVPTHAKGATYDLWCDILIAPWSEIYAGGYFLDYDGNGSSNYPTTFWDIAAWINWEGYKNYKNMFRYNTSAITMAKRLLGYKAMMKTLSIPIALIMYSRLSVWGRLFNWENQTPIDYKSDDPSTWFKERITQDALFNVSTLTSAFTNTLAVEPFLGIQLCTKAVKMAKFFTAINTVPHCKTGTLKFQHLYGPWYYNNTELEDDDGLIDLSFDITAEWTGITGEQTWQAIYAAFRDFPLVMDLAEIKKEAAINKPETTALTLEDGFKSYGSEGLSKLHQALLEFWFTCETDTTVRTSTCMPLMYAGGNHDLVEMTDIQKLPYMAFNHLPDLSPEDVENIISIWYLFWYPDYSGYGENSGWLINRGTWAAITDTNIKCLVYGIEGYYDALDVPTHTETLLQPADITDAELQAFFYFRYKNSTLFTNMDDSLGAYTMLDAVSGTPGSVAGFWTDGLISIYTEPHGAPGTNTLELNKPSFITFSKITRQVTNPIKVLWDINDPNLTMLRAPGGGSDGGGSDADQEPTGTEDLEQEELDPEES
jgi:hypothetical protein